MELRPHRVIKRRKTREIKVGKVSVGGNSKISVVLKDISDNTKYIQKKK